MTTTAGGPGRPGSAVVLAGAAGALGSLDTALNIAFPDLLDGFGIEVAALQWVVVTFVLSYGAGLLVAGQIGDAVDHRLLVQVGAVCTAAAMAACGLAPSFAWFLSARVAQGFGTAMVMAGAPALATASTTGVTGRGRALGAFNAATGLGAAAGPAIGGPLVALGGWPAVFWFRVPLALGVAALAMVVANRARAGARAIDVGRPGRASHPGGAVGSDIGGAVLVAAGLAAGMLVLGSGRALGPRSPLLWAAAGAAVAAVVAYRRRARRHPAPVLDPRLLGQPAVGLAAILAIVANGSMFVAWLLVPTLVVDHLGLTPVVGGLALAAAPLAMGLVAPTAGRWVDRAGTGRAMAVGLAVEGAGLGMLAAVSPSRGIAPVAAAMALVGVGLGVFAVANMTAIMGALPDDRQGTAGGLALMLRTVGIVAGVAGSAALFDVLEPGRGFVEAYRLTTSASVVVALGGALVAARFIGLDRPGTEGRRSPA